MVKQGISFHSNMKDTVADFHYGVAPAKAGYHGAMDQGQISERGFNHMLDCVIAMKEVLGDKVTLALDCGPGWFLPDAIRFASAVEKYNLMWLEDMLTGDYVPWVNPQAYRELTISTSTPIHTGEQIYLRHNFKELIETQAVRVVGPDPADIGGIAELKWVAEHAYMHSIMMAPHGTANGLLGLGALINVCATLPANYIAFEYPQRLRPVVERHRHRPARRPIVKDSMVDLLPRPRASASTSTPRRPPSISARRTPASSIRDRFPQESLPMKITDIKCAVIANSPVIRITTDEGITGWSQIETPKPYVQPQVLQTEGLDRRAGPARRRARHAPHPRARRLQAVRRGRQRHRASRCGTSPARPPTSRSIACSAARCATRCGPIARSTSTEVGVGRTRPTTTGTGPSTASRSKGGFTMFKLPTVVPLLDGARLPEFPLRRRAARRAVPLPAQGH